MPKCCVRIVGGKVVSRQCTSGFCPSGFNAFDVDDCDDCPAFPAASSSIAPFDPCAAPFVLNDVARNLAFAEGQLSAVSAFGGTGSAGPGCGCGSTGLDAGGPDISPLFAHLRITLKQSALGDKTVAKLVALVDDVVDGGDLAAMFTTTTRAVSKKIERDRTGNEAGNPRAVLRVRSLVDVIAALNLVADMLGVRVEQLPDVKPDMKCKGTSPQSCKAEPRWRCLEMKGGCVSTGPA